MPSPPNLNTDVPIPVYPQLKRSESSAPIRVFVVDEHPVVIDAIRAAISGQSGMELVGSASSVSIALEMLGTCQASVAVVDIGIRAVSGLNLVRDIRHRFPLVRVLGFSAQEETLFAERTLRAGACGYLMKCVSAETLMHAIRSIAAGDIVVSDVINARLLRRFSSDDGGGFEAPIASLSDRELQVLYHIGENRTSRQIAELSGVTVKTVEAHRARLREKLGLRTNGELVRYATQWVVREGGSVDLSN